MAPTHSLSTAPSSTVKQLVPALGVVLGIAFLSSGIYLFHRSRLRRRRASITISPCESVVTPLERGFSKHPGTASVVSTLSAHSMQTFFDCSPTSSACSSVSPENRSPSSAERLNMDFACRGLDAIVSCAALDNSVLAHVPTSHALVGLGLHSGAVTSKPVSQYSLHLLDSDHREAVGQPFVVGGSAKLGQPLTTSTEAVPEIPKMWLAADELKPGSLTYSGAPIDITSPSCGNIMCNTHPSDAVSVRYGPSDVHEYVVDAKTCAALASRRSDPSAYPSLRIAPVRPARPHHGFSTDGLDEGVLDAYCTASRVVGAGSPGSAF
ncbi:hypothetical protein BV25DRAFT_1544401 [Artomyces pyxidatus]|uniref:Uncharacterized protein n=1 Tax=Artomyces pyxidatus TaxID=48021 RepID=A0ACB8SJQ0_9AGAM|nr:hypothetical protein BV25DRAFT_1544401 [Artomyces pyxidatus]